MKNYQLVFGFLASLIWMAMACEFRKCSVDYEGAPGSIGSFVRSALPVETHKDKSILLQRLVLRHVHI